MSYDPAEPTPRDVIRGMAGDTAARAIVPDETYDSVLASYGVSAVDTAPFYRAAADLLRRVAVALEQKPTSLDVPGAVGVGWSGARTKPLTDRADALDARAAALEAEAAGGLWGPAFTVRRTFLTGTPSDEGW